MLYDTLFNQPCHFWQEQTGAVNGQQVEEVVVARQLDDDHEQDLNNEDNKKSSLWENLLYFTAKNEYSKQGDSI